MKIIGIVIVVVVLGIVGVMVVSSLKPQVTSPNEVPSTNDSIIPTSEPTVVVRNAETTPRIEPGLDISLTVISPQNNATVTSSSITVRGKTTAGAEVFVNEQNTVADTEGNFLVQLDLEDGENYVVVTAIDDQGNAAEQELVVTFEP